MAKAISVLELTNNVVSYLPLVKGDIAL
jgi:hypothetical protein